MKNFGPFLDHFCSKNWPFLPKSQDFLKSFIRTSCNLARDFWFIFRPFLSKNWPFLPKNQVFGHFIETTLQNCLKLGQKLGTVALFNLMVVLWLWKLLFWLFWPFLVKNTLHVVTLYGFWLFLAIFFQTVDVFC